MAVSAIARNLLNALCNLAGHGRFAGYGTHGRFSARWCLLQRSRRSRGGAGFVGAVRGEDILRGKEVGAAEKHIRRMSAACRSGWFPGRCFWRRAWPGRCWLSASALRPYSPPRHGCYLTVSLTPQERESLQQLAADRRLPVAVFVRESLRREYRSNGHAQRLTADADAAGKEAAPV